MEKHITIIECPRDAMQGLLNFIPTAEKSAYLNKLLKVGFDVLDCGSFVSPKAIPQMQDTAFVLGNLDIEDGKTQLLVIVANIKGAELASNQEKVSYLGYPFSISETFQRRNTNRNIEEAFEDVKRINEICQLSKKELVLYLSMGFGNPYGDPWSTETVENWVEKLRAFGIKIFSLSDTAGNAKISDIQLLFSHLIEKYPELEFGAHFHSIPTMQIEKIDAALQGGCKRFDSAMLGFGGCPMAADELTGNISTEILVNHLNKENLNLNIDLNLLKEAEFAATLLFNKYF